MENKIINIIFELLESKNLYNYDNDKELKNVAIKEYTNILGEKVVDIALEHEVYTIHCFKSYADKEVN